MRQIRSAWVRRKSRERKLFRFVGATILLFTLVASGFYVFDMIANQGAYKIYVDGFSSGGTNTGKGIKLTYDPSYGSGYSNLNGKGIRVESSSYRGMSFSTQSLKDHTGKVYKNCLAYLMSVASNDENTVQTNVTDKGKTGEANGDEFLASKFFLINDKEVDLLNGDDGVINYAIRLSITENTNNALSASRFALIEVKDETNIFNYYQGTFDNYCFSMKVIAQPKMSIQSNGDILINRGDEEDSQEYVSSTITGDYTNTPGTILLKNPNKGKENEDWKCTNLHFNQQTRSWVYDSLIHEKETKEQVFSIDPQTTKAYVVAAWFEATDPNHGNSIHGGRVSFDFTFYAVNK